MENNKKISMFYKTILISDMGGKQETVLPYALNFTKHLSDNISIIHVVEQENNIKYIEKDIKSSAWQQLASKYAGPDLRLSTNILSGKKYTETVLNFVRSNDYDLVAIPKNLKEPANPNIFSKYVSKQLIDQLETPVIIY